jgi:hypothetical protein
MTPEEQEAALVKLGRAVEMLMRQQVELVAQQRAQEGVLVMVALSAGIPLEEVSQWLTHAKQQALEKALLSLEDRAGPSVAAWLDTRPPLPPESGKA